MADLIEYAILGVGVINLIGLVVNTFGIVKSLNSLKQNMSNVSNPQNCAKCGKSIDAHTIKDAKKCGLIK